MGSPPSEPEAELRRRYCRTDKKNMTRSRTVFLSRAVAFIRHVEIKKIMIVKKNQVNSESPSGVCPGGQ